MHARGAKGACMPLPCGAAVPPCSAALPSRLHTRNHPSGRPRTHACLAQVVTAGALPVERVQHLSGGIYAWASAGLPMIGEYDGSAAGRTPAAAVSKPAKQ